MRSLSRVENLSDNESIDNCARKASARYVKNSAVSSAYVLGFTKTKNDMSERSEKAISLGTLKDSGAHYFMLLKTGKKIKCHRWEELPITQEVVDRVEQLAREENQMKMTNRMPLIEWEDGQEIEGIYDEENAFLTIEDYANEDGENDSDYTPSVVDEDDMEEQFERAEEIENNIDIERIENVITDNEEDENENENDKNEDDKINNDEVVQNEESTGLSESENEYQEAEKLNEDDDILNDTDISEDEVEEENEIVPEEEDKQNVPLRRTMRLNAGKGVERTHPYVQFVMKGRKEDDYDEMLDKTGVYKRLVNVLLTQVSAKEGIRRWGEEAIAAIMKELKQLQDGAMPGRPVIEAVSQSDLTDEDKRTRTLEAVTVVKQKRCGKIKGRTCADGSKQRRYLKEFETVAAPTLSLDGLIGSLLIDVYEERDVVTCDVAGAFLHPDLPPGKRLFLVLRGQMVDIMCDVSPEYKQHVMIQGGKKILYVRVIRSIYGCIEAALLWYELYKDTLEKEGFKLNPYELCVANKEINGHQCTIAWYMDDNKVSHKDPLVVTNILNLIESKFGKLSITSAL